jgi:nucleotide-binding universal stress UspA family protein
MINVKKIVCPTDFSEPSYEGVKVANDLCLHFSAELILIHVLSSAPVYPATPMLSGTMPLDATIDLQDLAQKSLLITVQEKLSPETQSRPILMMGSASDEIVKVAEDENADFIVISTHGHTGWRRFIFGSVAEKVVRLASCPVLTIPSPDAEREKGKEEK